MDARALDWVNEQRANDAYGHEAIDPLYVAQPLFYALEKFAEAGCPDLYVDDGKLLFRGRRIEEKIF